MSVTMGYEERKTSIGALVTTTEKREFKKRCLDHGTTASEVIRRAMRDFMATHSPKTPKYEMGEGGVV